MSILIIASPFIFLAGFIIASIIGAHRRRRAVNDTRSIYLGQKKTDYQTHQDEIQRLTDEFEHLKKNYISAVESKIITIQKTLPLNEKIKFKNPATATNYHRRLAVLKAVSQIAKSDATRHNWREEETDNGRKMFIDVEFQVMAL